MGDFNFKEINWAYQNTSFGTVHISSKFVEVVRDSFLFQHVNNQLGTEMKTLQVY